MWRILPPIYLNLASALRFKDPVRLQGESYISDKQFSKSQHLASYVFPHMKVLGGYYHGQLGLSLILPPFDVRG
jgi:hypothetical protein